jgi:phage-related protein
MQPIVRPLAWIGASKKDFVEFPAKVQDDFGYRLHRVQIGAAPFPPAKPLAEGVLKGLGIHELAADYDGDTYRAVYTVKLEGVLYVLHAFKKKSKTGIATPRQDIELIRSRYAVAVQTHARLFTGGAVTRKAM